MSSITGKLNVDSPTLLQKHIVEKPHLLGAFCNSASFAKIIAYVQACAESVEELSRSAWEQEKQGTQYEQHPIITFFLNIFFPHLQRIVDEVPLEDMAQQRFGNRAFRVFYRRLEEDITTLMRELAMILTSSQLCVPDHLRAAEAEADKQPNGERVEQLATELVGYMKDAFGNSMRIDYGTGHELHFFIIMIICLQESGDNAGPLRSETPVIVPHKIQRPSPPPVSETGRLLLLRRAMVMDVFGAYLSFVRTLQRHYKLEPAGSHGVWGLDDYHHLPFIFGASQLINQDTPSISGESVVATSAAEGGAGHGLILPKHVCEEKEVQRHAKDYYYFAQIMWILENKSGPFFEHSSMLYNISGVESWLKTYTGMVKMYAAEVLSKFNVVQHLLFGPHLPWAE
ncbi:putative Phosphotyrosyl phosphate activator (PTPA) protein [Trypanosoma vivax]|uniref:Serine/threonine-protein phosphatase 2A activator n=1 Tax=Trypanosoma vivax (strain Y486) TaxID=1055687 RepID=G0U0A6_TRYVY|nr:putative protein phosphatase 2A, regulatory subunit B [Trypanosoma vivax]KAH8614042.1 putative Phosphotyrosyl phosphate activator (PTPA) protein [Trypanosoma vivax]CCC49504.1 putative protein phosphatase 2A, regulatory subunit B [Trypanosoma vivax Y486]